MAKFIDQILPLQGVVQHYQWGGAEFIPALLDRDNEAGEPFAELWMGAHPRGPALVRINQQIETLEQLLQRYPEETLGAYVLQQFGPRLPFLFKVLDVHKMLSIQAHPTKEEARKGFYQENEKEIPLNAFNRVFKDDNHKPEVMVALTDFWLLHGFRSESAIRSLLKTIPEFHTLKPLFEEGGLKSFYQQVMCLEQAEVNQLLRPMQERLQQASLSKDQPEYWARQAFHDYTTEKGDIDRGVFSIFLLNLVNVPSGEGIFQDAGIPHAYLEGINIELMANSDNVFRGGLTPKHIDVPALMAHLRFDAVTPQLITGVSRSICEDYFPTPSPDFELSRIELKPGSTCLQVKKDTPQIVLVLEGTVEVDRSGSFSKGAVFYVKPTTEYHLTSPKGALLFKAGLPERIEQV